MEKYDLAFYDALTGCCKKVKFIIDLAEYKNLYDGRIIFWSMIFGIFEISIRFLGTVAAMS